MAQIFGIAGARDHPEATGVMQRMARVLRRPSQTQNVEWFDASGAVAVGCFDFSESGGLYQSADPSQSARVWVLDGSVYRVTSGADRHAGKATAAGEELEERIGDMHARSGTALPEMLDGSFCLALYDAAARTLLIANDRFSTRILYWSHQGGRLVFASELKALIAASNQPARIDGAALAQCAAFNRILGDGCLVDGVRRMAPGTCIVYDLAHRTVRVQRYWRPEERVIEREPLNPGRLGGLVDAFRDAVVVRTARVGRLGISLSGGLDSRAIAAVLGSENIQAYSATGGLEGCADQRLAQRVSEETGTRHQFYPLHRGDVERYEEALRKAVYMLDGMALVGGFPGNLTQQFCAQKQIDVLLRGHGGENAKLAEAWPFQVNAEVLAMRDSGDLVMYLRRSLSATPDDVSLDALFGDVKASGATAESTIDAVRRAVEPYGNLTPPEIMSVLYLTQNDGAEVPVTRNALRGYADMALPYLDYRFMDLLLGTTVGERQDIAVHVEIMRRHAPMLLRIPNSNTGAPVDASPLRRYASDKLNTLFRKIRIPGYRHYHYMEEWIQGILAERIRAVLLDPRTLDRGVFSRDYLVALVNRSQGDRSLSRLINFIVNFELWCRLFIDGEFTTQAVSGDLPSALVDGSRGVPRAACSGPED